MILLRTLGSAQFEGGSASLAGRRRELALAAFLAFRAPRSSPRAELASLLWETSDDARARQSLRQALLELKRVLGDALRIDTDQVAIDPGQLTFDLSAFSQAVEEDRPVEAIGLWRGEFLSGMDDLGGEVFRTWLDSTRETVHQQLHRAYSTLIERAATAADWAGVVTLAEGWATAVALHEPAARWLVEGFYRTGAVAEAERRHARYIGQLWTEMELRPSAEFSQLLQRLGRDADVRRAPGSAALFSPDFVGRGSALAELCSAWELARAGQTVVVLLEGEPGSGKTRLAEEFRRALLERREPVVVLHLPAPEPGLVGPSETIGKLLAPLADVPGLSAAAPGALSALGALVPAIGQRFPASAPPAPLHEAMAEVLAAVAEERPVLLWLDDVNLVDPATRALLVRVIPELRGRLLILTAGWSPASGEPRLLANLRRLVLPALSAGEIESLLGSMLALAPADRGRLAARLHGEGGGNPFYAIEMTSGLVDDGSLTATADGGWRLTAPDGAALPLPSSLRAAIARRLERLGDGPRAVATAAAVLGRHFDRGLLGAVAGLEPAALEHSLDSLIAARLLRDTAGESGELEFRHDLTARVVYDRMPLAERYRLHATAAEVLGRFNPDKDASRSAVAYHRARSRSTRHRAFWAAGLVIAALGGLLLLRRDQRAPAPPDRVVVASFENRTGDSTLNAAGQFMADWITQGIAQSDIVPVIDVRSALNSQRVVDVDTSRHGVARLRALAADAGATRIIWGSYALTGDSLVVQATISDAATGQVLRVLAPVRVPSRDPSSAVAQVSQGVLGALALLYNAREMSLLKEVQHPPVYSAYRAFIAGMDLLVLYQSDKAAAQFSLAHRLDTTFTQSLAWEADAYEQVEAWALADSVLQLASRSRERLGSYEKLFLDYRRAELAGDFGRALAKAREMSELAPGSEATFLQAATAIRLYRPHEALRALAQVNPEKGFLKGWDGYWGYPMQAHMMLGQMDLALADAREGRRRYPDSRQAVHQEVTVLSAMGNEAEVDRLVDVEDGLPASPGLTLPRTLRGAATTFRAYGYDSSARRMAERAVTLLPDRDTTAAGDEDRLILVEALYLLDRYAEVQPIVARMTRRFPDDLTWQGYTGLLAARLGHRTEADSLMRRLADDRRPFIFGRSTLWRARIEVALGNDEQAIALLRTCMAQGVDFDQAFIKTLPDFKSLRRYPEFQDLFKPRD